MREKEQNSSKIDNEEGVENDGGKRSEQSDAKSENSQSFDALKPEVLSDSERIKQCHLKIKLFELLLHFMAESNAKENTTV